MASFYHPFMVLRRGSRITFHILEMLKVRKFRGISRPFFFWTQRIFNSMDLWCPNFLDQNKVNHILSWKVKIWYIHIYIVAFSITLTHFHCTLVWKPASCNGTWLFWMSEVPSKAHHIAVEYSMWPKFKDFITWQATCPMQGVLQGLFRHSLPQKLWIRDVGHGSHRFHQFPIVYH